MIRWILIRDQTEGDDLGLGHGSISENSKWVTYRSGQKWRFWRFRVFLAKKFFVAPKMSKIGHFYSKYGSLF